MITIQATVSPRLLTKASRLFTGTLHGRITEILQNARRAGARRVHITNHEGQVTVRDDGDGILDSHLELKASWLRFAGPDEPLRCQLLEVAARVGKGWKSVTIWPDGRVLVRVGDGKRRLLKPPEPEMAKEVMA
jgi:hypothetical protein